MIFTLALVAAFATAALAQAEEAASAEATTGGPEITFEQTTIDYGVIEKGSDPYRIFTFTNTGNEPLIIKHAKGSCGCTVPSYAKEPIEPGAAGEIKVRYDTNRMGKFNKRVTLTTNAGDEQVLLYIKGEVVDKPKEPAAVPAGEQNMFNNGGNE